jgi:hypothetical protein
MLFSLGFLVLAPVVTASIYTAYRDVFLDSGTPAVLPTDAGLPPNL